MNPKRTVLNQAIFTLMTFSTCLSASYAQDNVVVLPVFVIEAMEEGDPIKTYVDYKQANVTRNGLDKKDIPQTIDTIDVSKYKIYGANDLSVMLQGTPGVSTNYDTRGDGISVRGFDISNGDVYRDGIRESGQVRRSTANVERIEILKGPASVLYGRGAGGGVVNMVTKFANFDSRSSVGGYIGSYENIGGVFDLNKLLSSNWAVRLTAEKADSNSFRKGIDSQIEMISPSVTYRSDDEKLIWTTQYTFDKLNRTPDRGPNYENLPTGTSIKTGFARPTDFIEDELQTIRTDLKYALSPDWNVHWSASYRQAYQDFDNFFAGTWCGLDGKQISGSDCNWNGYLRQSYAWQETMNKTISNTLDLTGKFKTGAIEHQLMVGTDWSHEDRDPKLGNYSSGSMANLYYGYINPYNISDNYLSSGWNSFNGQRLPMTSYSQHDAKNLALFVQDLISLTPTVKMMVGLRYDAFEFETHNVMTHVKQSYDDNKLSPNVGFVWQPRADHSFYTSYNKSFAPYGGRGMISIDPTLNPSVYDAEPQYNEQYEIGVKSDWFDQQLNTQISLFEISKNNIRYQPDAVNRPEVWEVGQQQQSKGVELSFVGKIWDDLYARGGYGFTDATWTKDSRKLAPAAESTRIASGNRLFNVSENTGNLFLRYLATDKLYGELGATYVGSFYTNNANTAKVDGWTRADAALGYKTKDWSVTAAVNNLTNKEYWRAASMPGMPRNYLLRVNYLF